MMVFAAAMVVPAVAEGRNDVRYRDTRGVYANCGPVYDRDHDRGLDRRDRGHDRDLGYFRR